MMIEQVTVVAYQNGIAKVQCEAKTSCGSCVANTSCGTKALSALAGEKLAPIFDLVVDIPLEVGDRIQIGVTEQTLFQSVFWLYCVPLFVLIISTLGLSALFDNEVYIVLGIISLMSITFVAIKWRVKKYATYAFNPIFLGKLNS